LLLLHVANGCLQQKLGCIAVSCYSNASTVLATPSRDGSSLQIMSCYVQVWGRMLP